MRIWLINDYNCLPEHGQFNRNYYLAKYIKQLGHEPIVFAGSHPHNTQLQLIEGNEPYRIYQEEPFPWVLIKTQNYEGSKKRRVFSMFEFYQNMKKAAKEFEKPDAIIGSSAHPLSALVAIKLGKKYSCKGIMEVRDLWPESIVAHGVLSKNHPIIQLLYSFEKYLYVHADELIFTMENAWQYLEERGLDKLIPKEKVHYINNGVDLEEFRQNLQKNPYHDDNLAKSDVISIVYTGSIRRVNKIGLLLDAAKLIENRKILFLIWGAGDELEDLKDRCRREGIRNVVLNGPVQKKYIASITSQAYINFMHGSQSQVLKYGLSANKLFDYAAAGKPILVDFVAGKNPVETFDAGVIIHDPTPEGIAKAIDAFVDMSKEDYMRYCTNAERMAEHYSYQKLAMKMIQIIQD